MYSQIILKSEALHYPPPETPLVTWNSVYLIIIKWIKFIILLHFFFKCLYCGLYILVYHFITTSYYVTFNIIFLISFKEVNCWTFLYFQYENVWVSISTIHSLKCLKKVIYNKNLKKSAEKTIEKLKKNRQCRVNDFILIKKNLWKCIGTTIVMRQGKLHHLFMLLRNNFVFVLDLDN